MSSIVFPKRINSIVGKKRTRDESFPFETFYNSSFSIETKLDILLEKLKVIEKRLDQILPKPFSDPCPYIN